MNHPSTSLWPVFLVVTLLTLISGTLHAAPTQQQWQTLNSDLVSQHVLPRYQQFMTASQTLQQRTEALCQTPEQSQLEDAQAAYRATLAAWQQIQHVQFGPVENLMRNFSIQFWPDKKNLTSKQLNQLLAAQDSSTLQPDYFHEASIAVKGLPALERLLFAESNNDGAAFASNHYRCQLSAAIAAHLAVMAADTYSEWQRFATDFDTAGDGVSYYDDHAEAATDLLKALVEPVEVIRDLKILAPLGEAGKVKPRRLESWRSQHSLRNLQLNIHSLHDLYSGTGEQFVLALLHQQGETALAAAIEAQFVSLEQQLNQLPAPLASQLNSAATQQQLQQLAADLKTLHQQLTRAMQQLDVQLGFNSRDGD